MKLTYTLWILFLFLTLQTRAQQSAASSSPVTITNTVVANGISWTNPSQVSSADNAYTSALISGSNKSTDDLDVKGWGFQSSSSSLANYIPSDAQINGIVVTVHLKKELSGTIKDNAITLLKAGSAIAANKARKSAPWPSTASYVAFGTSTDLWGTTWTPSDLTNSGFGFRISAKNKGKRSAQADIDDIRITVYFNQSFFYSKSSGNLESTSSWGTATDGTGTAPANFTNAGQVFILRNRTATSLTGNLTISGTHSKLVIGDGAGAASATTLTVPASYILNAPVEIAAHSGIQIAHTVSPSLTYLEDYTTVTYNATADQTLSDVTYYNLTLGGSGKKYFQSNTAALTTVSNTFTISAGITADNQGNTVVVGGAANGMVNNGTANGSGHYTYSLTDANTSLVGTGTFSNLEIDAPVLSGQTSQITLSNPVTITSSLTLTDGTLVNGTNLSLATGSLLEIIDGTLTSAPSSSYYDLIYGSSNISLATGNELAGTVRNLTIQITSGNTLSLSSNLSVAGNLTISSGTLDPTTGNYSLTIGGNFTNNATLTTRSNTITFNGSSVQTISGSASQTFYNLVIKNGTGGSVSFSVPVTVSNGLTLASGIVTTSAASPLTLGASATLTGGSAASYISGPLLQTVAGTSATTKVFPIGKAGVYRPVTLTVTHNNNTPTLYTGEMFTGAPPTRTLPSTISSLSKVRYYTISSSTNSANLSSAVVTLSYGSDDNVTSASTLRIVKSADASSWTNIGGSGTAAGTGTITSSAFYSFSDFVLGATNLTALPLSWLSFTATPQPNGMLLQWETASEVNTNGFEVEKSTDGAHWKAIGRLASHNQVKNSYSFTDEAPDAVNYYRIRQFDADGSFTYSRTVQAGFSATPAASMTIAPQPVVNASFQCRLGDQSLLMVKDLAIKIMDLTGRIVYQSSAPASATISVHADALKPGVYVLAIQGNNKTTTTKFMVQ